MPLSKSQKGHLRALGHHLKPVVWVGQHGLRDSVLAEIDQALDALDAARELDPRDPTPLLYQGIILRDLNRPTEAVRSFHRAIVLNDNRAVYRSRFLLDGDLAGLLFVGGALLLEQP